MCVSQDDSLVYCAAYSDLTPDRSQIPPGNFYIPKCVSRRVKAFFFLHLISVKTDSHFIVHGDVYHRAVTKELLEA